MVVQLALTTRLGSTSPSSGLAHVRAQQHKLSHAAQGWQHHVVCRQAFRRRILVEPFFENPLEFAYRQVVLSEAYCYAGPPEKAQQTRSFRIGGSTSNGRCEAVVLRALEKLPVVPLGNLGLAISRPIVVAGLSRRCASEVLSVRHLRSY